MLYFQMLPSFIPFYSLDLKESLSFFRFRDILSRSWGLSNSILVTFYREVMLKLLLFIIFWTFIALTKKSWRSFFPNSRLIINVLHNPGCNNCQPLMSALISNWNQPHLDASKRLKVIFQHRDFLPCLRHLHCHFMDVASGELWLCHISKTHNAMSASQWSSLDPDHSCCWQDSEMIKTFGGLLQSPLFFLHPSSIWFNLTLVPHMFVGSTPRSDFSFLSDLQKRPFYLFLCS